MKNIILYLSFILFAFSACEDEPEEPANLAHHKAAGSSANDFLSAKNFTSLTIEIQHVPGFAPTQAAMDKLKTVLEQRLNKPGGITVTVNPIPATGLTVYTLADVVKIESERRTKYNTAGNIAAYYLFLNGTLNKKPLDTRHLGRAYFNTSMVVFEEDIHTWSNEPSEPDRDVLEATVMIHEFGHLLGLVNTGSPMQTGHNDESYSGNCNNNQCVMYWGFENEDFFRRDLLASGLVPDFDQNCINDLIANGGK